ncbi:hypothetical protein ACIBEF_00680 [Micromonospora sp. NPDC050795]|uniref:hypothetical protein n=1 Tax=Micromonospora sp. NPDC050795 TaxID=3364282 RepID=UPI0037A7DD3D
MDLLITIAVLALTHALAFRAGDWWRAWRGLRHQLRAAETAISTPAYLAQVAAVYRQRIRDLVRLPRLPRVHLPHFHSRRSA